MNPNKTLTLIEYSINSNTIRVSKAFGYGANKNFTFEYSSDNNQFKNTVHSTYKTIAGAMKKFNKAVKALKEGTNIK